MGILKQKRAVVLLKTEEVLKITCKLRCDICLDDGNKPIKIKVF